MLLQNAYHHNIVLNTLSVNVQCTIYLGTFISYFWMRSASSYMRRLIPGISSHSFTIFVCPKAMEFDQDTDHRVALPAFAIKTFQLQYIVFLHRDILYLRSPHHDSKSCSVILHGSAGFTISKISSLTSSKLTGS